MRYLLILVVVLSGCDLVVTKRTDYRGHAAALLALYTSQSTSVDVPDVVNETHDRSECPTGGWITHGDGHKTRCSNCRPAWDSDDDGDAPLGAPPEKETEIVEPVISVAKEFKTQSSGDACEGPLCRLFGRFRRR